jgi:UDP-glucose 4-epimerase
MKWLITGGCGFIGTSLIRTLYLENKHFIRVVDNLASGSRDDLQRVCDFSEVQAAFAGTAIKRSGVQLVVGDIRDAELAVKAARDIDIIVHLAASTGVAPSVKDPVFDCNTNVIGTLNYLEGARQQGVSRFVFASSGAVVGECEPPIHEKVLPRPVSPYGVSKMAGEGYCSSYFHSFGIQTVVLRFGNVYGPLSGHKNSVVAKFIRRAMDSRSLEIYGDGKQTRDFIYIDDLVHAIRLAVEVDQIGGEVFQIATNAETDLNQLADKLIRILDAEGFSDIQVVHTEPRQGDVRRNFADTAKAKKTLGWQVKTDLDSGLAKTVAWFKSPT